MRRRDGFADEDDDFGTGTLMICLDRSLRLMMMNIDLT